MNKLNVDQRTRVISALMEGAGVNATARMTGVSKPTILKLVVDLGAACAAYHDDHVRDVNSKKVYNAGRLSASAKAKIDAKANRKLGSVRGGVMG